MGGCKHESTNKGGLKRCYTFDLSRQRRQDLVMNSENAHTCYDRMQHTATSLSIQGQGVPQPQAGLLLETLQLLRFFLRTGHGDSRESYGGSSQPTPFQGGC